MKVYIDYDYKCHLTNDGTMQEVESEFFDNRCKEFIEGYRFVPEGQTWTRADGAKFIGEMITPWRRYDILETAQQAVNTIQEKDDEQFNILLDSLYNSIIEV